MDNKEEFGNFVDADSHTGACMGLTALPPMASPDDGEPPAVLAETAAIVGEDPQNSEMVSLAQEVASNDNKPKNGKNQRIGAEGLDAERQAVYTRLDHGSDEPILAIAIDLDIPEERALKYYVEWKEKDAKNLVRHPKDVLHVVRQRLKLANGQSLEPGTPLRLEFTDDDTSITITPYVKKG